MRFTYTSLDRAIQASRRLCQALDGHGHPRRLNEARHALAAATGYATWAELKLHHGKRPTCTPFDESLEVHDLAERLHFQASGLTRALGLEDGTAALVVAEARLTAHPAGPHVLEGPSAARCLERPSRGVAFRGVHPDTGPIIFKNGTLDSILNDSEIDYLLDFRMRWAENLAQGGSGFIGSYNLRLHLTAEEFELGIGFSASSKLMRTLQSLSTRILFDPVKKAPLRTMPDLSGPPFLLATDAFPLAPLRT